MEKFLELETRVYLGKELRDYFKNTNIEELDEADAWKKDLMEAQAKFPKFYLSKIFIDPDSILAYIESFSLEQAEMNSEQPKFDTIDLSMRDGLEIAVVGTIAEFNKKLKAFYKNRDKKTV